MIIFGLLNIKNMKKENMNAVLIVPSGTGCEIGGHCGESVGLLGNFNR
jgi:hypothetical protein